MTTKTKAKKPARMGRPPIADPKNVRMNIRVTEAQRDRYHRAANAEGVGLATWVQALLDSAAPPPKS